MSIKEQSTTCNNQESKSLSKDFVCPNCGDVHTYDFTLETCCENNLNQ